MMQWMPHSDSPNPNAFRWTLGEYEIEPADIEVRPRYVVKFRGEALPGEPCCLSRARQRAEQHMTMTE